MFDADQVAAVGDADGVKQLRWTDGGGARKFDFVGCGLVQLADNILTILEHHAPNYFYL
jgi:hypothetical protein